LLRTAQTTTYSVQDIQRVRLTRSEDDEYDYIEFDITGHRTFEWQHHEKENLEIVGKLQKLRP